MTDETPTREQLNNELKDAEAAHVEAQNDHKKALDALQRARGDKQVSMEALIELADTVSGGQAKIDRAAAVIATLKRRIDNFDVIAKRDEREALVKQVHDGAQTLTGELAASLRETGVDKLTITVELVGDEGKPAHLVSVKPAGAKLTAIRGGRSTGGNGRGFKSAGAVTVDGTQYASLNKAYVTLRAAADGIDEGDVTPANSQSASNWLAKNGHTIS